MTTKMNKNNLYRIVGNKDHLASSVPQNLNHLNKGMLNKS